ncbi:MAG: hypothetical protein VXZ58_05025, partial [Actinomycetota bacterium]|nr:hypothetical protein [Actinomycetota bacterium]
YVKDLVISNFAGAGNVFVQAKGSSGKMYIDAKGGSIFLRKDHTGAQFIFDVANTKAGFGTTAPDRRLHVYAGYVRIGERGTAGSTPSTTSTDRARLELIANANSNNVQALVDARDTGSVTCMQIGTTTEHEIRFYTNSTERMRLANDGKLALGGQIDPDAKLHVYNGYIRIGEKGTFGSTPSTTDRSFSRLELLANANSNNVQCFVDARDDGIAAIMQIGTRTSHGIRFYTGNDERMRLTSGGNLCLGTTSTHNRFHVVDSVVGTIAKFDNTSTNTSADGIIVQCGPDTESNMTTDNTFIFFRDGTGDVVGRIHAESGGGGVTLADSFTGAHVSVMPSEDFEMGLIVDSTGDMWA